MRVGECNIEQMYNLFHWKRSKKNEREKRKSEIKVKVRKVKVRRNKDICKILRAGNRV